MAEPDPALRASDADRERTATALRDHAAVGRLSPEELDERLTAAYGAVSLGELDALLADLPPAPVPARAPEWRADARRRVLHEAGAGALVVIVCVVVWLLTSADASFWPKWVMLVVGIRLAFLAYHALGPGATEESARRALERHQHGDRHRGRGGLPPAR